MFTLTGLAVTMSGSIKQQREAPHAKSAARKLRCLACARRCVIDLDRRGYCKVRMNSKGTLFSSNYGRVVTVHIDMIEKKPVYHYRPQLRHMVSAIADSHLLQGTLVINGSEDRSSVGAVMVGL